MNKKRMYKIWLEMKKRCEDASNPLYKKYGGLGIGFQSSWEDFEVFYKEMKIDYAHGLVLDRHNSHTDFSRENCYWIDVLNPEADVQNRINHERIPKEKKKLDKFFFYNGVLNDIAGFSLQYNINYMTLKQRLSRGWSIERALTEPIQERKTNKN
jgi:hypothetical protein